MDKKTILAVILSMAIWVGWQKLYLEPMQKQAMDAQQKQEQLVAASLKDKKIEETKASIDATGILPAKMKDKILNQNTAASEAAEVVLENNESKIVLTNEKGALKSWELKKISNNINKADDIVTLPQVAGFSNQLSVRFSDEALNEQVKQNWNSIQQNGKNTATISTVKADFSAQNTIQLSDTGYGAVVEYKFKFNKEAPKFIFFEFFGNPKRENDVEGGFLRAPPDKVHNSYRDETGHHTNIAASLKEDLESASGVRWMGLDTRYFALALSPVKELRDSTGLQIKKDAIAGIPAVRTGLVIPTNGNKEVVAKFNLYFGPKDMEALKVVDPIFIDIIDFGWTSVIAVPLLQALKWLYVYVHNYGIAIILLTFFIKMALFPLTYKSSKSMAKMVKLQPQLNALREKYKDNKEKLNTEMMSFMKSNGYNPVGGCLPMLIQMPIFFALYRMLFNSMELYQAPFMGWIHDLSSPDPLFITPITLSALMFLQQKISPQTATDPAQQKMLQWMPVMFGAFMLFLPAGLTIYMLVNSLVSIVQQYSLNKKFGVGKYANANNSVKA